MKRIILGLAFTLFSIFTVSASDCFDAAIKSLERAEAKYGMMSDEQATNYLNEAYGDCEVYWAMTNH